ncbi:hypothetical protein OPQ81_002893 [Rhizoctonia solani]|nr:hypothetical protein OPQ81_002893 [Rhizoctonia solani]
MITLRRRVVAILVTLIISIPVTLYYRYQLQNAISYASRPLWDTPEGPKTVIPHFYALGLEPSPKVCKLHGVKPRSEKREVWDAVLFSTELDLLEVRLNELDAVVDRFFVVESNRTFTGISKQPILQDALLTPQFARFRSKITYQLHPGRVPNKGESPFKVEREHRLAMTKLITSAISPPLSAAPLVIMSDVDEIPAAHTIDLVKNFEWPSGWRSWRAQVEEWGPGSQYVHSHSKARGDHILWDSGWHCSFCFKTIEEFVTKMRGYSHADRIGGDMSLLDPKRIQATICSGRDIFNMLPEAYTYKEMFELMNPEPTKSAVGIPRYILEHPERFGYLLPGGGDSVCARPPYPLQPTTTAICDAVLVDISQGQGSWTDFSLEFLIFSSSFEAEYCIVRRDLLPTAAATGRYITPERPVICIAGAGGAPVKKRGLLGRRGGSALVTPSPRHTSISSPPRPMSEAIIDRAAPLTPTNVNTNLRLDSDDEPLVPPPPRSSVFAGFSYSDSDRPRAQTVPAESERPRPPRPQVHPHQRLQDDMKGKLKKDGSSSRTGLFGWRKKEVATINTNTDDSSFSLNLPVAGGTPPSSFSRSTSTGSPVVTDASPTTASTARPIPGRSTPVTRERVNSTSSEGMMTAGLFRQAARRSSTNLVEEAAEPIRSRMRDLEKRSPPTRSWAEDSIVSSGSDRPNPTGPRKSAPNTSSRKTTLDNKPRKSLADVGRQSLVDNDDEPDPPSPFAGRLGESGRTSPFTTRSESGHVPRVDYSMYGARSDGGIRSGSKLASSTSTPRSRPASPTKPSIFTASPAQMPVNLPNTRPGPQGYTGPRSTSPTKPRPSSPEKRTTPSSPTKPRLSAPSATRPTRSPIRTTIPTKTNDGPSIKPHRNHKRQGSGSSQSSLHASSQSALGHGRRPSAGAASARSVSVDALAQSRHPNPQTTERRPSVDVLSHTRRPSGFEVVSRPKSPGPASSVEPPRPTQTKTTDQLRQEAIEAMRRGANSMERATSPAPSLTATRPVPDSQATPRKNYVPPPRGSSLAVGLVDSDSDESPEEVESESEGLGFGKGTGVGAMRGRHRDAPLAGSKTTSPPMGSKTISPPMGNKTTSPVMSARPGMGNGSPSHTRSSSDDQPGLTRERTITQRDAAPPKIGVSLFDGPVSVRPRASHSTGSISAAATARNSAALAEANRAIANANRPVVTRPGAKKHNRGGSFGAGSVSHVRSAAIGTDTDEDEEDESEESSEDDAPLSSLAPAKRPGSAASTAASVRPAPGPRPSAPLPQTRATAPLISIPGVTSAPHRPPRMGRVPGVGVTRNSSLRGSRSVEDLGRMPARPGPRPFAASPPSSTGDSSSGKAPLTPRDGSESGRGRSDEARRKERRRSEAKKSVELGNVINGPGPIADDDDEDSMSMHHSQMGHAAMGMMGMGWNQSGFFPPGGAPNAFGPPGFPTSQSMPFLHPQLTGPMGFMPPPPPPGANEAYLQAHQQAMLIAKQTYLSAVAQQAMAAATEQWERSSNMGGSVYGGLASDVAGWGSASAYGGPSGPRSVYGGGARSEFGGGMKKPGPGQNRPRGKTQTGGSDSQQPRREQVPPSTWATRRKMGL